MRLFIAFDTSEELKKEVLKLKKTSSFEKISFIPISNLHVTIKFLGEVHNPEKIVETLEKISFKTFEITNSKLGFFPNKNFISVIWIGFEKCDELLELKTVIDNSIGEIFKEEYDYIPHLTLARVNWLSDEQKIKLKELSKKELFKETFKVSSFKLMKSTLTKDGHVYESIREFKAKGL